MARCSRIFRILFLLVLLTLTPLSFSADGTIVENAACGGSSQKCVEEIDSTCNDGEVMLADHFLSG